MNLEETNTETSLNNEDYGIDSKREMMFKSYAPSIFTPGNNLKEKKTKKKRNINIKTQKEKNEDLTKSSYEAFEGFKSSYKINENSDNNKINNDSENDKNESNNEFDAPPSVINSNKNKK